MSGNLKIAFTESEPPVRQVLLPGRRARREPGCQGHRHGTARPPSRTDADDVARQVLLPERQDRPDTTTRQDLRDDKIGTDQGGSDVPRRQPSPSSRNAKIYSVIQERSRRTLNPVEPRTPGTQDLPNPDV